MGVWMRGVGRARTHRWVCGCASSTAARRSSAAALASASWGSSLQHAAGRPSSVRVGAALSGQIWQWRGRFQWWRGRLRRPPACGRETGGGHVMDPIFHDFCFKGDSASPCRFLSFLAAGLPAASRAWRIRSVFSLRMEPLAARGAAAGRGGRVRRTAQHHVLVVGQAEHDVWAVLARRALRPHRGRERGLVIGLLESSEALLGRAGYLSRRAACCAAGLAAVELACCRARPTHLRDGALGPLPLRLRRLAVHAAAVRLRVLTLPRLRIGIAKAEEHGRGAARREQRLRVLARAAGARPLLAWAKYCAARPVEFFLGHVREWIG